MGFDVIVYRNENGNLKDIDPFDGRPSYGREFMHIFNKYTCKYFTDKKPEMFDDRPIPFRPEKEFFENILMDIKELPANAEIFSTVIKMLESDENIWLEASY